MNKLPKIIYVYVATDGDESWLEAGYTPEACAVKGESRLVGVYALKRKVNVTLQVKEEVVIEKAKAESRARAVPVEILAIMPSEE